MSSLGKLPPSAAAKLQDWLQSEGAKERQLLIGTALRRSGLQSELPLAQRRALLSEELQYVNLAKPENLEAVAKVLQAAMDAPAGRGHRVETEGLRAPRAGLSSWLKLSSWSWGQGEPKANGNTITSRLIGGIELEFGEVPKLSLGWRRPKAQRAPFGPQTQEAKTLAELFNQPRAFQRFVEPLPITRMDHSMTGTRGFSGKVEGFSGKMMRFTGVGVVRADSREAKFGGQRISVDAPEPNKPVSEHMQMGTMHVDDEGNMWSVLNHEPFGAYTLDALQQKVELTEKFGARYGVEVESVMVHRGTEVGGLAYSIPEASLTPLELLRLDLLHPTKDVGRLFGNAMNGLLREARSLHDEGYAHSQLHPGNWFGVPEGDQVRIVITDWGTIAKLDALKPASEFSEARALEPGLFEGLSPTQKLRAIDVRNALMGASLLTSSSFHPRFGEEMHFGIETDVLAPTVDAMRLSVRLHAQAIAGYLEDSPSASQLAEVEDKIWAWLETLALATPTGKRAKDLESFIEHDERPHFILMPATNALQTALARAVVQMPKDAKLEDLTRSSVFEASLELAAQSIALAPQQP